MSSSQPGRQGEKVASFVLWLLVFMVGRILTRREAAAHPLSGERGAPSAFNPVTR